jgi:N-acetylneuraminic acid mutarotase
MLPLNDLFVMALMTIIIIVGGRKPTSDTNYNLFERYDTASNQWTTLSPMPTSRGGVATAFLNGKLYAIGGYNGSILSKVEVFDPVTGQWSVGQSLPNGAGFATAIATNGKILLFGGKNSGNARINQVLEFDPATNQWTSKASMPTARSRVELILVSGKIWAIGGTSDVSSLNKVEIYDVAANSWSTGVSTIVPREGALSWLAQDKIYLAGGSNGSYLSSIESYDFTTSQWSASGSLPESIHNGDSVISNNRVYLIAGSRSSTDYSDKVFAADVTPPMDLYFRDANVSGSVALASLSAEVLSKLDGNASALPPVGSSLVLDANGTPPVEHAFLEGSEANATLSIPARNLYFREVNATQPEQPSENRPPKFSDEGSEVADNSITTAKLSDGSVTAAKLSSQLRDDLNATIDRSRLAADVRDDLSKTVSRPFGASLANPYGILGTPILTPSANYTVPAGKVLVIKNCQGNQTTIDGKTVTNYPTQSTTLFASCFVPSGKTVVHSSTTTSWSGFLHDSISGITPVLVTSQNYSVPAGMTLVITSMGMNGGNLKVDEKLIFEPRQRIAVVSGGKTVVNTESNSGWTGYLLDPTQFE